MADEKLRILFVDDEPRVLQAIERQLRRDRGRWEMVFALGGQSGLDELRSRSFAVVVSDFRMPVVDGLAVLSATASLCPAAARIMLSGDADARLSAQQLLTLQELLVKPCNAVTLRGAIERGVLAMRPP